MIRSLVILVMIAASAPSHAQPAGAQAEVLFREGRDLMAKGKYPEACASFEQSQKLDPAMSTLLNLAGCREKNNQLATAWGLFLEAERQSRAATDESSQAFHDVAKDRATKLEPRVSKLTINVPQKSQLPGLEIVRGAERVETVMWNRALPVDGGTYTVTARAPGAGPWSTRVTVASEGDTKTVDVPDLRNLAKDLDTPPDAPAPTPVTAQPAEPDPAEPGDAATSGSGQMLPIVIGAGGVALLGAALGFELSGRSTYDDAKAEMVSQSRRDELYDSANTKRYLAQGFAVAGIGCAGIAVWLYLRDGGKPDKAVETSRRIVVSPTGLAVVGRF